MMTFEQTIDQMVNAPSPIAAHLIGATYLNAVRHMDSDTAGVSATLTRVLAVNVLIDSYITDPRDIPVEIIDYHRSLVHEIGLFAWEILADDKRTREFCYALNRNRID